MWLVLASVQALVFAPVQKTVLMAQVHALTSPERRRRLSKCGHQSTFTAQVSDPAMRRGRSPDLLLPVRLERLFPA
jgi:hypothetical protein